MKLLRPLGGNNAFVSYVDAIGELDNELSVIDWKTSTSCYPAEPEGLCALDPQMICYSWMTGIERVALVVFVRKRIPEIQYLKATISEQQRQEFGRLVAETVRQIEACPVPAAQRYPLSPEPVSELRISRPLPRSPRYGRPPACAAPRSRS